MRIDLLVERGYGGANLTFFTTVLDHNVTKEILVPYDSGFDIMKLMTDFVLITHSVQEMINSGACTCDRCVNKEFYKLMQQM